MSERPSVAPLPFGIPQLDQLLGYGDIHNTDLTGGLEGPTSMALVGEDGTGKSVFAMHAAAQYQALRHFHAESRPAPLVIYASSDFRFDAADRVWKNFYLDYPWYRYVPFLPAREIDVRRKYLSVLGGPRPDPFRVPLVKCSPNVSRAKATKNASLGGFLDQYRRQEHDRQVCFLDLSTDTTGDDWLFVARLLASIPRSSGAPPHLLVVDSMAGFETLVGDRNSFGELMSRRARIAQIMRAAGNNWHLIFVVEEPEGSQHNPEEYVTDTVIHLRRRVHGGHTRRTLEIEKSRARAFGHGEHPFDIRDGAGSSSKNWENPDDPRTLLHPDFRAWHQQVDAADARGRARFNAYVQLFPSLHFLSKEFAGRIDLHGYPEEAVAYVPTGVPYLDMMLAPTGRSSRACGLPAGQAAALIGDEGTRKTLLAEQYVLEAFADLPQILRLVYAIVEAWRASGSAISMSHFLRTQAIDDLRAGKIVPKASMDASLRAAARRLADLLARITSRRQEQQLNKIAGDRHKAWRFTRPSKGHHDAGATTDPFMTRWDFERFYEEWNVDQVDRAEHDLVLAFTILRMPWGLLPTVVFVATHDSASERLVRKVVQRHRAALASMWSSWGLTLDDNYLDHLMRLLERSVLVRRIELVDATAPQLWHVIYCSVRLALHLRGERSDPNAEAAEVRVVISDLRVLHDTYPSVAADPLFLPTLVFRLKRLGVTTVIVDSENGRPDAAIARPMNGALRSLVDLRIYTWKVPFFGEQRVAISVAPAQSPSGSSVIRELRVERSDTDPSRDIIRVDPHFELYTGIEEGKPQSVPLQVVIYAETPAFEEYVRNERELFGRLFTGQANQDVMIARPFADYDAIRDYCHLPIDTRLPFSLVFMVDGYWGLSGNASLHKQSDYLFAGLEGPSGQRDEAIDVFKLYARSEQNEMLEPDRTSDNCRAGFFKQMRIVDGKKRFLYRSRIPEGDEQIDRVPFLWDFGLLLCDERRWLNAYDVPLSGEPAHGERGYKYVRDVFKALPRVPVLTQELGVPATRAAGGTDGGLRNTADASGEEGSKQIPQELRPTGPDGIVGWRWFFEACKLVAAVEERRTGNRVLPFDMAMSSPEAFSCLLLEVWVSEIMKDALRFAASSEEAARRWAADALEMLKALSRAEYRTVNQRHRSPTLQQWLVGKLPDGSRAGYPKIADCYTMFKPETRTPWEIQARSPGFFLQFYKTWLLLLEVLDFNRYFDPQRPFNLMSDYLAEGSAIAVRHWYKTACLTSHQEESKRSGEQTIATKIPVRLPGHFSTRGDWFLAVADGSRSHRLAEQALDLLTSRRTNRARMHLGMGLPTRDFVQGEAVSHVRTRLTVSTPDSQYDITYGALVALGGRHMSGDDDARGMSAGDEFYWLFRSGFGEYDRQATTIRRWIQRLLSWTIRYRHQHRANWQGGFAAYDQLERGDLTNVASYTSLLSIARSIDIFVEDLSAATLFER